MGGITAPVRGSGRWPPWMTRVAKRWVSSLMRKAPFADRTGSGGVRRSLAAAQPVEQVDARDEALELARVHDDGHHAALEDLHELRHRRIDRHGDEVARHGARHRLVEERGVG